MCRRVAFAYYELGRDGEAEAMYRRAIQLRPTYWQNHSALGIFLLRRGRLDEAQEVFRRVLELRPESDTGYVNLAAAYILAGKHTEAEPLLLAALRLNPTYETHNNLGTVYYALGKYDEAAREWQAAIDGGGKEAIFFSNLGDALRQLRRESEAARAYDQAIDLGRQAVATRPDDHESRAGLAMALAGRGQCGPAREEAGRASRPGATLASAYYAAVAYALCGPRESAVREAVRAIEGGVVSDVRTNPDLKPLLGDPLLRQRLR
jgi:Flp pilus assembly protein TadD